jgi:hypothetical protein
MSSPNNIQYRTLKNGVLTDGGINTWVSISNFHPDTVLFHLAYTDTHGLNLYCLWNGSNRLIATGLVAPNDPAIPFIRNNNYSFIRHEIDADYASADGIRAVIYPTAAISSPEILVDHNYDNVQVNSIPENVLSPPAADAGTGGLAGVLEGIQTWLKDYWERFAEAIGGIVAPSAKALEDIIANLTGIRENVTADTLIDTYDTALTAQARYTLPDLFVLILKVIVACIRLVLRSLIYVASFLLIMPDSSLLNSNIISGIDFLKYQQIPVFNISFWTMFEIMLSTLFGIAVIKRIRRMYQR